MACPKLEMFDLDSRESSPYQVRSWRFKPLGVMCDVFLQSRNPSFRVTGSCDSSLSGLSESSLIMYHSYLPEICIYSTYSRYANSIIRAAIEQQRTHPMSAFRAVRFKLWESLKFILMTSVILSLLGAAVPIHATSPSFTNFAPIAMTPQISPPAGKAVLQDPSGTYWFSYLGNGEYSIDLGNYTKLLQDPYSGIGGQVQVAGNTVYVNEPQPTAISYQQQGFANSSNWGGAIGGFCSFYSQNGIICGNANPATSINISQVYVESLLSWNNQCWGGGSSCWTGLWTGESTYNNSKYQPPYYNYLIQNGIGVCVNNGNCAGGGSSGSTTWNMWYEFVPGAPQPIASYPTTINNSVYVFEIWWSGTNTTTSAEFYWATSTWSFTQPFTSPVPQGYFYQSEGIFESPDNQTVPIVTWSPSPVTVTGWYRAQGPYQTAPCGNYGSSYPTIYLNLTRGLSGPYEANSVPNTGGYTYLMSHR